MEILPSVYNWIKVTHIVAVIARMSGVLYLPRLFVYHSTSQKGSYMSETFKIMERRLFNIIMTPAMIVSLFSGGLMIYSYGPLIFLETWLVVKIGCLIALIFVHIHMGKCYNEFKLDTNNKSPTYFRIINEVPTVLSNGYR